MPLQLKTLTLRPRWLACKIYSIHIKSGYSEAVARVFLIYYLHRFSISKTAIYGSTKKNAEHLALSIPSVFIQPSHALQISVLIAELWIKEWYCFSSTNFSHNATYSGTKSIQFVNTFGQSKTKVLNSTFTHQSKILARNFVMHRAAFSELEQFEREACLRQFIRECACGVSTDSAIHYIIL